MQASIESHSGDHSEYESRFGIPQMLVYLKNRIFEGLPNSEAQLWRERFMSAFIPGGDYSHIGWQFLYWLLTDKTINPGIDHELVCHAVRQCADMISALLAKGRTEENEALAALVARNAESAALSAKNAAESACGVAWSTAWGAAESAYSAVSAAESVWNVEESAENAACIAAYAIMASKLIELIKVVKPR